MGKENTAVTQELDKQPQDPVVDVETQDDEQANADFGSGLSYKSTPQEKQTAKPAEEEADKDEGETQVVDDAPKTVQLSEEDYQRFLTTTSQLDELRASVDKQFKTAFGKIGGYEQLIRQMQEATPKGKKIEMTDDLVSEMKELLPDMADAAFKSFKKFAEKLEGTGGGVTIAAPDPEAINKAVRDGIIAAQTELLEEQYPDWHQTVHGEAFQKWLPTVSVDYQKKVLSSANAAVVASAIDKFNKSKEAPPPPPDPKKQTASRQQAVIRGAVPPKGVDKPVSTPSDLEQFYAGIKSG